MKAKNLSEILIDSNANPKKEELGSKSVNSLELQKIGLQNKSQDWTYFTPRQTSIPMSVLLQLLIADKNMYANFKTLQDQIDKCNSSDLEAI